MSDKLVIFGYDGVPYNFLYDLIQSNKLPNFKNLIKTGSYGVLSSIPARANIVSWLSSSQNNIRLSLYTIQLKKLHI